jgi:hypothetical protein
MTEEIVRARAFADPAAVIAEVSQVLQEQRPGNTPAERELWELALEHAQTAVTELAALPTELLLAWPSGVPQDVRATLTAQLQSEVQRVAYMRLRAEFLTVFAMSPMIARSLGAWMVRVAAAEGAGQAQGGTATEGPPAGDRTSTAGG